ncbi:formin-like protein 5 [Portunus trituberculatus]|uniref:formin-like protein 5 n=1 Tax=Portunus trituberculatus TaxID=210409 RepID=UPI001E1CEA9B|nr:formin-like protein 5 [Portunus trituberculatus]
MSRPGSCTSKLCGPARTSKISSDTRRLSGHSPQKWSLVCTVSSPTSRRQTACPSPAGGCPTVLSMEEFSVLVDRVHEAHVESPPQQTSAPACLCSVNAAAPTDQPTAPAESLSLHVLQQQAAVTSGGRRNPPLAAVPSSTETRLAPVKASLRRLEALLARSPTQTDAGVCFYHRRFGEEARSYRPPCAWPARKQAGGANTIARPRLSSSSLPRRPISASSPPAVQPTPGPTDLAPPPPLAPQCFMEGHDAPASPGRPTVGHTSSPPAKQRSRDGQAPSPPPSRLQLTGGRASASPTHLRVSAGRAPSQPSVGARHPYWPPVPPFLPWSRRRGPVSPLPALLTPCAVTSAAASRVVFRQPAPVSLGNPGDEFSRCSRPIIHAEPCAQPTPSLTTLRQATQFEALLQEFPHLTSPQSAPPRVQHGVQHSIVTTGPTCFARPRRLPPERLHAAREEFDLMLEEGIVRPSDSNWASPLHMVPKAQDGEWRDCGDYRALNAMTHPPSPPVTSPGVITHFGRLSQPPNFFQAS